MRSLDEIKKMNADVRGPQFGADATRPCSISVDRTLGGTITGVILHSATNRDTMFVDWEDPLKQAFFKATVVRYGVDPEALLTDPSNVDREALDRIVESYWGIYPRPDKEVVRASLTPDPAE